MEWKDSTPVLQWLSLSLIGQEPVGMAAPRMLPAEGCLPYITLTVATDSE